MRLLSSRILIVDDEPANVLLLERLLEQLGYNNLESFTNPEEALPRLLNSNVDLVLLDIQMPNVSGFDVLEKIRDNKQENEFRPVMILTADATPSTKRKALALGADDFLTKPFEAYEVALRVKNLLRTRLMYKEMTLENDLLEQRVLARTKELEEVQLEVVDRLGLATEYRDDDTKAHTGRVGEMASKLAKAMDLPPRFSHLLRLAAPLHDIGKIGISDLILLKEGKLTDEEYETMKKHCEIGASILSGSKSEILQLAQEIAISHHERWDGRGYPNQLSGEDIPLSGRIVSVVDVFDALTHERTYKKAWPIEEALMEIKKNSGTQFDPTIVKALMTLFPSQLAKIAA
ncbi:MAG: HD domain-containing phosphohydrolase [Armatimonadota bacterium]